MSEDEHALYMEFLIRFGYEWKTSIQIRDAFNHNEVRSLILKSLGKFIERKYCISSDGSEWSYKLIKNDFLLLS